MALEAKEMTAAERIDAVARELGLTMTAVFVPWSQSRNKAEKHPSLNWTVTLHNYAGKRAVLTTDYGMGCGHCSAYKASVRELGGHNSLMRDAALRAECEKGRGSDGKKHEPDLRDVLYSLMSDAGVLDSASFEDWASELGYDTDSRSAEATYRACLDIALKLRHALGETSLAKLREACEGY
jgi:hypothetical protein